MPCIINRKEIEREDPFLIEIIKMLSDDKIKLNKVQMNLKYIEPK